MCILLRSSKAQGEDYMCMFLGYVPRKPSRTHCICTSCMCVYLHIQQVQVRVCSVEKKSRRRKQSKPIRHQPSNLSFAKVKGREATEHAASRSLSFFHIGAQLAFTLRSACSRRLSSEDHGHSSLPSPQPEDHILRSPFRCLSTLFALGNRGVWCIWGCVRQVSKEACVISPFR
ncbi:hypothetical protein IE53DRAFT_50722 [Violaceomyces palustris]|uniref:Uncharacterized protein n=1 Tax=Violaceomyces palustris TaxID=1673888 RepID=A0ACD0NZX2_9BASI|nr:hypothetical protein IE53DRAFT_50722 [Violaceomyces palustris]